jgi:hypothetical protein
MEESNNSAISNVWCQKKPKKFKFINTKWKKKCSEGPDMDDTKDVQNNCSFLCLKKSSRLFPCLTVDNMHEIMLRDMARQGNATICPFWKWKLARDYTEKWQFTRLCRNHYLQGQMTKQKKQPCFWYL